MKKRFGSRTDDEALARAEARCRFIEHEYPFQRTSGGIPMKVRTRIFMRVLVVVLALSLNAIVGRAHAALIYDFEFVQGTTLVGTGNVEISRSALDSAIDVSSANAEAPAGSRLVSLADLTSLSFTILAQTWVLSDATTFSHPTTSGVEGVLLGGGGDFLQFLDAQLAPGDFDTIGVEFVNSTPATLQFLDGSPLGWSIFGATGATLGTGGIGSVTLTRVPGPATIVLMLLGLATLAYLRGTGTTQRRSTTLA